MTDKSREYLHDTLRSLIETDNGDFKDDQEIIDAVNAAVYPPHDYASVKDALERKASLLKYASPLGPNPYVRDAIVASNKLKIIEEDIRICMLTQVV